MIAKALGLVRKFNNLAHICASRTLSALARAINYSDGFVNFANVYTSLTVVAITGATYYLDQSISRQETSITLYQEFVDSEATKSLRDLAFEAVHRGATTGNSDPLAYISVLVDRLKFDPLETRKSIARFIEGAALVQMCRDKKLCDRSSVGIFFQTPVSEIFFLMRPLIYCDNYTWDRFGTAYFGNETYIGKTERLVMYLLEEEQKSFGYEVPIYRTSELKNEAKAAGVIAESVRPFVVSIDRNGKACKVFKSRLKIWRSPSPSLS